MKICVGGERALSCFRSKLRECIIAAAGAAANEFTAQCPNVPRFRIAEHGAGIRARGSTLAVAFVIVSATLISANSRAQQPNAPSQKNPSVSTHKFAGTSKSADSPSTPAP